MKKLSIVVAILVIALVWGSWAQAADQKLTATIKSVTVATDKNGDTYVRLIIPEDRNLQGIDYTDSVPVMAFGVLVAEARAYKAGDELVCIAKPREYQGRKSYTVLKFLE